MAFRRRRSMRGRRSFRGARRGRRGRYVKMRKGRIRIGHRM